MKSLLALFLLLGAGSFAWRAPATPRQPADLPLVAMEELQYVGAFRLPADEFGISSMNYSEGPLAYSPARDSILIVGHSHQQAVAEFTVPGIVNSTELADLPMAVAPRQTFATVLDRTPDGNPESLDRIGGLAVIPGADHDELLVNAYEYYDAPGDNTLTTLVVRDATDLAGATVDGYVAFAGGAGHTSGWLSLIPLEWQTALGGRYLTGQSSGMPIIGRSSVGPSAFAFDPDDVGEAGTIPTETLLDFSLDHPLHADLENAVGDNDLWTHLSRVTYGFIAPGTRTYVTLGYSGGHASGVCYKCTQDNGNVCGGYCAPQADDYDQYVWLWDVDDLVAVREGRTEPHAVRPYAYGPFATPFETDLHQLGGASFDPAAGLLYITVQEADRAQGEYANPPVVVVYRLEPPAQHHLFLPFLRP